MESKNYFKVGYVQKPHGLKGEVTMAVDDEAPEELGEIKTVFLQEGNDFVPYFIETISVRGAKAFVKFEEVDTPEGAAAISKRPVYLPKSARPRSARGEFYDDEIEGFIVVDEEIGELGPIVGVVAAGPNKLISLTYQEKEVLIPVNGPFIKSVNKSRKRVSVLLPEGFLDI